MCPYDGGHLSPRGSLVTPEALTHKLFMHLPLPPGAPVALSSRGPQCTGRCSVDMNHQVSKCGLNRAMGGVRGGVSHRVGLWEPATGQVGETAKREQLLSPLLWHRSPATPHNFLSST